LNIDGCFSDEVSYDLAMYLNLFTKNCFPSWTEVFTIAGKVCTDLSQADDEYYSHLMKISKINAKVNQKVIKNYPSVKEILSNNQVALIPRILSTK
jgi:hypothetical protein